MFPTTARNITRPANAFITVWENQKGTVTQQIICLCFLHSKSIPMNEYTSLKYCWNACLGSFARKRAAQRFLASNISQEGQFWLLTDIAHRPQRKPRTSQTSCVYLALSQRQNPQSICLFFGQLFGCSPSLNIYTKQCTIITTNLFSFFKFFFPVV